MSFYPKSVYDLLRVIDGSTVMSAKEVLVQGGLDYTVSKRPIYFEHSEGNMVQCPHHVATVANDDETPLGVVSESYGLVQHLDSVGFTEDIVRAGEAQYVHAGHDGTKAKIFIVMKTPDFLSLGNGDNVHCYFFIVSSHDGSLATSVFCAPYRPTTGSVLTFPVLPKMRRAKGETQQLRFRHTKKVLDRMTKAQITLSKVKAYWQEATETFPLMQTCKVDEDQAQFYFTMLVKDEDKDELTDQQNKAIEEMLHLFYRGTGSVAPACAGTILGCYLAAVDYIDRKTPAKKTKRNAESYELLSKLTGTWAQDKAQAYCMMLQLQQKFAAWDSVTGGDKNDE
jgi:phage/plasmid-like protein (TIGR03299 family)